MFQRILVPLDDAMRTAPAIRIASGIARQTGAQLVLLHTEPSAISVQGVLGARTSLQRQVTYLRQQGIQAEYAVEVGSREQGIIATARDRQVDLILLVPAHRQHFELLWYSRSATRLLHELPAPLLIWPESSTSLELLATREAAVMVPLDGAPEAERSVAFAMSLAERYHQSLVLVRAIPTGPDGAYRDVVHGAGCFSDQVQEATANLDALREQLERTTTILIKTAIVAGEPGTQVLRAAQTYGAGIIVLCSHSRPTMGRYFMGCVSTQILRQASVPVMVVPPHLDAPIPVSYVNAASGDCVLFASRVL